MKHKLETDFNPDQTNSIQSLNNESGNFGVAYYNRLHPTEKDNRLLEEFERIIEVMPLDTEDRVHLIKLLKTIRNFGCKNFSANNERNKFQSVLEPVHQKLGELQTQGSTFWYNPNRFNCNNHNSTNLIKSKRRHRGPTYQAVDTVNPIIPTCWFKHLPHESGDGIPVGSPLSRSFQVHIAAQRLHSADLVNSNQIDLSVEKHDNDVANQILNDRIHATFWQSYCKRVKSQMAVWLPHSYLPREVLSNENYRKNTKYGAILPQVIASGTVSRRAVEPLWLTASNADKDRLGSEIKAMVQAPPGYCFVGADVDSQEMWIASLIGDSSVGFQGSTPYGWMTLQGNKTDGTDLHTKIANQMGIKRNESKVLNYARLYGSGFEFTSHLLAKFCNMNIDQASMKAKQLLRITKGQRVNIHPRNNSVTSSNQITSKWQGGTESAVFNELEKIARSSEPCTPVLKARLTRALNPQLVKDDFLPSRINWVVQSSAVDYLHCMLVFMGWLIKKFQLPARLCISIHDELRYICPKSYADQIALALQISNLFTRTYFAYQLGMRDLPESVAYFSSVEIDTCLRKDPKDDCITPSNPEGIQKGYGIPPGQSLTMQDILNRTGGRFSIK